MDEAESQLENEDERRSLEGRRRGCDKEIEGHRETLDHSDTQNDKEGIDIFQAISLVGDGFSYL